MAYSLKSNLSRHIAWHQFLFGGGRGACFRCCAPLSSLLPKGRTLCICIRSVFVHSTAPKIRWRAPLMFFQWLNDYRMTGGLFISLILGMICREVLLGSLCVSWWRKPSWIHIKIQWWMSIPRCQEVNSAWSLLRGWAAYRKQPKWL